MEGKHKEGNSKEERGDQKEDPKLDQKHIHRRRLMVEYFSGPCVFGPHLKPVGISWCDSRRHKSDA